MKKRLTGGLLAFVLLVSLLIPTGSAQAASTPTKYDMPESIVLQILNELGIMTGDGSGDLMLSRNVTRAEFAKMLVTTSTYKDNVSSVASTSPFRDVPGSHWAAGYIKLAVEQSWLTGYLDGTYRPDQNITLEEAITGCLKLLGYTTSDFSGAFPYAQLSLGDSLGLLHHITATQGVTMTRQNMSYLFYNVLLATGKENRVHATNLNVTTLAGGEIDVETLLDLEQEGPAVVGSGWESALPFSLSNALIYRNGSRANASDLEEWDVVYWSDACSILWAFSDKDIMTELQASISGPVIATSGWQSSIPFDVYSATVTRNGVASTASSIATDDVIYYSKADQVLYVYSNKITGTVESISPSATAPSSVTIGGKSYSLETNGVKYSFSDLGTVRVGDTVTLLLGRDSSVAGLASSVTDSTLSYGIVTDVGSGTYLDASGSSYTTDTLTVITTSGTSATYQYKSSYLKTGDLVSVQYKNSELTVTRLTSQSLSGKVSNDGTTWAGYTFASDIEILDTYGTDAMRIFPSRLAGVTVSSSNVRYYITNGKDEITHLILSDLTGDLHEYGVLTSVTESSSTSESINVSGSYQYDIGGTAGSYQSSTKKYGVKVGPFLIKRTGNTVDTISNLTKVSLTAISSSTAWASSTTYILTDAVTVYRYSGGTYYLTSLSAILDTDDTITGWYDNAESAGGRIRVIVVQ